VCIYIYTPKYVSTSGSYADNCHLSLKKATPRKSPSIIHCPENLKQVNFTASFNDILLISEVKKLVRGDNKEKTRLLLPTAT
jgi:hypothetical protein